MKKKYTVAVLLVVLTMLLTGCSIEGVPSFRAMMVGEPEMLVLPYNPLDYVTLGEYKNIQVSSIVTDAMLDSEIDKLVEEKGGDSVKVKEGTVKKGDRINYDYTGKINGKKFDRGEEKGASLRIGSGNMIDGFEDALTGMKVGETKDAKVTFPKDYGVETLNGKEAVFTLKVNYIYKEVDDTLISKMTDSKFKTVKEYKEDKKKSMDKQYMQQYVPMAVAKVTENAKIKEVPKEAIDQIKAVQQKSLESAAARNNTTVAKLLEAENLTEETFYESLGKDRLLYEAVAAEEGYRITKEKFQKKLDEILSQYNVSEKDYRNNFKEATGKNASFEDYMVYVMKLDFFYELLQNTMQIK